MKNPPAPKSPAQARPTHVLSITSGKGGVGKTNLVVNVAICLARRKRRVLVMDADMGLANVDILIGQVFRHNLSHVLRGEKELDEVIAEGPEGIHLLPSSSGVEWITELDPGQKLGLVQKMDALRGRYDVLLIDTGAGISSNVLYFNQAAQTRLLVVTPEPTSLTDAYAVMKVLSANHGIRRFEVVANQTRDGAEGQEIYRSLTAVTDRFLDVTVGYLGHLGHDPQLGRAVIARRPVVCAFPQATISANYDDLARRICHLRNEALESDMGLFWRQVLTGETATP